MISQGNTTVTFLQLYANKGTYAVCVFIPATCWSNKLIEIKTVRAVLFRVAPELNTEGQRSGKVTFGRAHVTFVPHVKFQKLKQWHILH